MTFEEAEARPELTFSQYNELLKKEEPLTTEENFDLLRFQIGIDEAYYAVYPMNDIVTGQNPEPPHVLLA